MPIPTIRELEEEYKSKYISCLIKEGDLIKIVYHKSIRKISSLPFVKQPRIEVHASKTIEKEPDGSQYPLKRGESIYIKTGTVGIFLMSWGRDLSLIFCPNQGGKIIAHDENIELLTPQKNISIEAVKELIGEKNDDEEQPT